MASTDENHTAKLTIFVEQAADVLRKDERIRILWLTGSLAAGTTDEYSAVELRAAVRAMDFANVAQWWQDLLGRVAPLLSKYRLPIGPADEATLSAITADYLRLNVVLQSLSDTRPRTLEAARLIFDKDGEAEHFLLTAPLSHNPYAGLSFLVEMFLRALGMLPIVVAHNDILIGMEEQLALHSMLISLLFLERGIDRTAPGKRHIASLNEEQQAILAQVPTIAPTMESLIQGRVAYGRLFLPRARRLMEAHDQVYPEAFEAATKQYLWKTLGLSL